MNLKITTAAKEAKYNFVKLHFVRFLALQQLIPSSYRLGTVNSNTVNSKFHLIRSFFEILPDSYHFMFKMHG